MEFRIIPDFLKALSNLSKVDQKSVRNTIDSISQNYEGSGLRLHKINHQSAAIFSYSVNRDIRIIVHREASAHTMLYVDHHDAAYAWVERRKFLSTESSLRIISVTESKQDEPAQQTEPDNPILVALSDLAEYKQSLSEIRDDDEALEFIASLMISESAKSELLEFVVQRSGKYSLMPDYLVKSLEDDKELSEALEYPLDLWRVFLHPTQLELVSLPVDTSRFITGGPGTGKTVCLVHRIKKIVQTLSGDQRVLLITYKEQLSGYISDMMKKMAIDISKVRVADVTEMNEASVINVTSSSISHNDLDAGKSTWRNCFVIDKNDLYYHDAQQPIHLAHIFIDEYQDFRNQQLDIIEQIIHVTPFTICLDYSQAIYRPPREKVKILLSENDVQTVDLTYCYRLNDQVIKRLKNILLITQVLSSFASDTRFQLEVISREEQIVNSLTPAIFGTAPTVFRYDSQGDLEGFIEDHIKQLSKVFESDELVVTAFFPEIYKFPQEDVDYNKESFPESVNEFYRYIYTLKGLEWKAGIVILDETICGLLNLNRSLFVNQMPEGFRGSKENVKRMFNLLYVALSRFRDYLCICYPAKYAILLDGMFE